MKEKNIKPHDSTLAVLAVMCSRELELNLAEAFLDEMSKIHNPRPYNAFLEACDVLVRQYIIISKTTIYLKTSDHHWSHT